MSTEPDPSGPPRGDSPTSPEGSKPSYSAIGRHLTALRDAASAILTLFAPHQRPEDQVGEAVAPPPPGKESRPIRRTKGPLEIRIERHAAIIDRALDLTARLNPSKVSPWELPQDVRGDIGW